MSILALFIVLIVAVAAVWLYVEFMPNDRYRRHEMGCYALQRGCVVAGGVLTAISIILSVCLIQVRLNAEYKRVEMQQQHDSILAEIKAQTGTSHSDHLYARLCEWNTDIAHGKMLRDSLFRDFTYAAYDEFDTIPYP